MRPIRFRHRLIAGSMLLLVSCAAAAFDFKTIGVHSVILYDAPSTRSGKLFIAPSGMPVEVMLSYGDWVKVRDATGEEDTEMAHWAGLGRRYPLVAVVFSMFLLAFAGIPLTSGFVAKFAVFKAAGEGGAIPLVIVGVIASAIAAYFYVRVIVLMFFTDPPADAPEVVKPSWTSTATVTLTAAVTLALGALPQPLLDLVNNSAQFVR